MFCLFDALRCLFLCDCFMVDCVVVALMVDLSYFFSVILL